MVESNQPQPGWELDEAIARLLGWKVYSLDSSLWRDGNGHYCGFIRWSTDDIEAFKLLQQLCRPKEDGGRGWLGYRSHYDCRDREPYGIEIATKDNTESEKWSHEVEEQTFEEWSRQSHAHAIALAILAALEAEQ